MPAVLRVWRGTAEHANREEWDENYEEKGKELHERVEWGRKMRKSRGKEEDEDEE